MRGQNLSRFWRDVVPDPDIVQLSDEDLVAPQEDIASLHSYWVNNNYKPANNSDPLTATTPTTATTKRRRRKLQLESEECTLLDNNDKLLAVNEESAASDRNFACPEVVEEIEEESQCSAGVFENGNTAAASPDSVLNFKNCLAKTAASGISIIQQDCHPAIVADGQSSPAAPTSTSPTPNPPTPTSPTPNSPTPTSPTPPVLAPHLNDHVNEEGPELMECAESASVPGVVAEPTGMLILYSIT